MFGFNELSTPVKAIIALAFVLMLVLIAGLLLRRIAGGRLKLPGQAARTRQPRLGIVDIFEMDRQRQLVLLRRDNVEHLVMIGGPNDLVIEASIVRAGVRAQVPGPADTPEKAAPTTIARMPNEPRLEALPEPVLAERTASVAAAAVSPTPPGPPVSPPPKPQVTMAAAAAGGVVAGAAALAATTVLPKPSASAAPVESLQTITSPVPPASSATPAAAVAPTSMEANIVASFETELARMAPPPAKPLLEPIAPSAAAKASASELDDMTRQLQEALKRPFSGVAPAATSLAPMAPPARSPEPATKQPAAPAVVEAVPVADSPSALDFDLERELAAALEPVPLPELVLKPAAATIESVKNVEPDAVLAAQPEPKPELMPVEPPAESVKQAKPMVKPVQETPAKETPAMDAVRQPAHDLPKDSARAAPKPDGNAPAPSTAAPEGDPFSVDAIEAEFARLLNRAIPPKN